MSSVWSSGLFEIRKPQGTTSTCLVQAIDSFIKKEDAILYLSAFLDFIGKMVDCCGKIQDLNRFLCYPQILWDHGFLVHNAYVALMCRIYRIKKKKEKKNNIVLYALSFLIYYICVCVCVCVCVCIPDVGPWTTKPVLSRWGIFVAIAKNTLYGSKL